MQSIFHVKVSTPEDLRQEFIFWCESRADNELAQVGIWRLKSQQAASAARAQAFREAADFWRAVIIDETSPPKENFPRLATPPKEVG